MAGWRPGETPLSLRPSPHGRAPLSVRGAGPGPAPARVHRIAGRPMEIPARGSRGAGCSAAARRTGAVHGFAQGEGSGAGRGTGRKRLAGRAGL